MSVREHYINIHINEQKCLTNSNGNGNTGNISSIIDGNLNVTGNCLPTFNTESNVTTNNILTALGLPMTTGATGINGSTDANTTTLEGSTSITSTAFTFDPNGTTGSLQPGDQVS